MNTQVVNNQVTRFTESSVTAYTAQEMRGHVQRIQEVMKAVMKDKTHFGIVPGTPKPSLWKPGAEVLCATFHIAPSYRTEDLSDADCIRYRVTCIGTHQVSGTVLGEGMGECSTNEEKYKWRRAFRREFEATDETRRRIKFGWDRDKKEEYETMQVRTEPADLANTVLKMACKRAQVAMTLNVTAASDIFTQDLEDMPEGLESADEGRHVSGKPRTQAPQARAASDSKKCTEKQAAMLTKKLEDFGVALPSFVEQFKVERVSELPIDQVDAALDWIKSTNGG